MKEQNENIFKVGVEVSGESMIGYKYHLNYIVNSFLNAKRNLSITGVKRIGKTSLAKEAMRIIKNKKQNEFIILEIDLARCDDYTRFLQSIIRKIQREVKKDVSLSANDAIDELIEEYNDYRNDKFLLQNIIEDLLIEINGEGKKVILMIDEFDAATDIFTCTPDFEFLRNMSSNSEMHVSLLLISRRQVYMIEKRNSNNSTFHGVITSYPINGFNESDMEDFFSKLLTVYSIALPSESKDRIEYYAGRSPYIWSMFGSAIVDQFDAEIGIDMDDLFNKHYIDMKDHYKAVYDNLSTDMIYSDGKPSTGTTIDKLIEILYGPNIDVSPSDIEILKELGYLDIDKNRRYYAISAYFTDYIRGKVFKLKGSFFDYIIRTEKTVKNLISIEMYNLCKANNISGKNINELQGKLLEKLGIADNSKIAQHNAFIQSNLKIFKQKSTYLDVMSLKDSFQIMVTNWDDIFSKYFGCSSVDKWKIKFDACAKARNPVAHGHEEFLSDEERKTTEGYCIEILDRLSGYVSNDIDKVDKQLSDLISGSENQSSITGLVDPVESLLNTFVKMKIMEVGGKNHNNLRGIIEKKYGAIIPKNYLSGVDLYSMLEREVEVQVVKINNGMYEVAYYSN